MLEAASAPNLTVDLEFLILHPDLDLHRSRSRCAFDEFRKDIHRRAVNCSTVNFSTSPRSRIHFARKGGSPCVTSPLKSGSPHGPLVSYTRTGSLISISPFMDLVGASEISRNGTRMPGCNSPKHKSSSNLEASRSLISQIIETEI